jgi:uncharacterized Zn-binding protein involved in type VI secretion
MPDSLEIYRPAAVGAKTKLGGEVITSSSRIIFGGHHIATVGDTVRYPDGHEEKITSGTGVMAANIAIIGSHISGGDVIISSPDTRVEMKLPKDGPRPEGFLVEGFIPQSKH